MTGRPIITIDGHAIAGAWTLQNKVALAGLKMTWGRRAHTDEASPTQLALQIVDADGELAESASLVGRSILVRRSDQRVIFRGSLDDFAVRRVTIHDPRSAFRRRAVWQIDLTAGCKLAELATTVPFGPGREPAWAKLLGPSYWPIERPAARLASVRASVPVVNAIEWVDPFPPELPHAGRVRYRGMGDKMTALELIESCYNAHPLGYVNYAPADHVIRIGKPAKTAGLELRWNGSTLNVAVPAPGLVVPARTIRMDRSAQARSTVNEQYDAVQIAGPTLYANGENADWRDDVVERTTAHDALGLPGRREYRMSSDAIYQAIVDEPDDGEDETITAFSWPFPLSSLTDEYRYREDVGRFHYGMDFGLSPATNGAPIPAAGAGKIVTSRYHTEGGWGNYIVIDHGTSADGKNLKTLYAHMQNVGLPVGTTVTRGQIIGYVGNTGGSFGAHLHYETWVNGSAINPRDFMTAYAAGGTKPVEPEPIEYPAGIWQTAQAEAVADMFDQMNGLVVLPSVTFDWKRCTYADAVTDLLIDTYAKGTSLYFPGSVFAPIHDAAAEHEVIGGTLTYDDGWQLDATLAPAIRTGDTLTIAQLVTIDPPTLDDFDADLILADLGNVTKGVTA